MASRNSVREAVSTLIDAGKTPTAIARELGCARSMVYKVKNLKDAGKDVKVPAPKRKKTLSLPRVRAAVQCRVIANPNKSISTVAKEVRVSRPSVSRMIKEMGGKSLRRVKVPLSSAEGRERRATRAAAIVKDLKIAGRAGRIIFFSDEIFFVVDPVYNPQNDRWIRLEEAPNGMGDAGKYVGRSKHPACAMFLGAVASTGEVSPPIWFPTGFRLDADAYIKSLRVTLIPWMKEVAMVHGSKKEFSSGGRICGPPIPRI